MSLRLIAAQMPSRTRKTFSQLRCFSLGLNETEETKFQPVYVHHLSQVALEHLQNNHFEWLISQNLHVGLKINSDGTFVLRFPESKSNGRIWTSYDGGKKQHWLSTYNAGSLSRYLMKDVLEGVMQVEKSVDDNVRKSVDEMILNLGKQDRSRFE